MARRRVVVLGGGVAGVLAARALGGQGAADLEVTVVTRRPWGPIGPFLPAVAAGNADPRLAAAPLRPLLRGARLLVAEVAGVDAVSRKIQLSGAEVDAGLAPASLPYDDVVVALGAHPAARAPALAFGGVEGAFALRDRLIRALEVACAEESPRKRKILTTAAILGGSPAACSLAGELLAALRSASAGWPRVERDDPRVVLLAPGELLPGAPRALSAAVQKSLTRLGVEVRLHVQVPRVAEDHLILAVDGREERLEVRTVIDAAAAEAPACLGPLRGPSGRVPVAKTLASDTFQGLWALGNCATVEDDTGSPPLDTIAEQAERLARNLLARQRGGPLAASGAGPALRVFPLAPGHAVGSLGPLPLPPALAAALGLARDLGRWWLTPWTTALLPTPSPPGLLARPATQAPAPFLTPAPPLSLPLPSLPLDGPTAPGLPSFTLPLPAAPPPRR